MELIQWTDDLSVNITEIDDQHKRLIALIGELNDAAHNDMSPDVLKNIFKSLTLYTITHFSTEEQYFDQYDYPEKEPHKEEHLNFVDTIADFKDAFEKGKAEISDDMMEFLSDWLRDHIMGTDQKYSAFFIEKGLK